jgi:hypothetical protein
MAKPKATPKETKGRYKLTMKLNDCVFTCDTDNLEEAILANKPNFLKTKVLIKIEKDGKICEKQIFGFNGRQLFRSPIFLRTLVNKLIFK